MGSTLQVSWKVCGGAGGGGVGEIYRDGVESDPGEGVPWPAEVTWGISMEAHRSRTRRRAGEGKQTKWVVFGGSKAVWLQPATVGK